MDKAQKILTIIVGILCIPLIGVSVAPYIKTKEPDINLNLNDGYFKDTSKTTKKITLNNLYVLYGSRYDINPCLLKAIAIIESSENPQAINQASDCYGLMQVLCQVDSIGRCKNKLYNINGWPPNRVTDLLNTEYNLNIGAQILKWNVETYGLLKGIACYNQWSARHDNKLGPFRNQRYVDKVIGKYYDLQHSKIFAK